MGTGRLKLHHLPPWYPWGKRLIRGRAGPERGPLERPSHLDTSMPSAGAVDTESSQRASSSPDIGWGMGGGASRSYTEMLPGSEFPHFRDLGTLYTGVFICSFLSGFPGFRTVQAHSRCPVNGCCPSMSKGHAVRMKSSHLAQRTSCNCHHHHCLCPLSRWDEGQQKGETRTQRVRSWARKGHSERLA